MVADASQLQWKQQISSLNQQIHNTQKSITTRKSWVSAAFSVISLLCLVSSSWAGSNSDTSLPALLFVQIQPEREQDIDKRSRGGKIWLERNFRNNEARPFSCNLRLFQIYLQVFCLQRVHFIIPRARGLRDAPSRSAAKYFQRIFDIWFVAFAQIDRTKQMRPR